MSAKVCQSSFGAVILLILIILYTLKGALYPTGAISTGVAVLELGLCMFFGLKCVKLRYKNRIISILFITCMIILVSYILSPKVLNSSWRGTIKTFEFFREFCGAILPAFASYYLIRSNKLSVELLRIFFYVMFVASIIAFFHDTVAQMMEENKTEITSNYAYRFVYLMPFVPYIKGYLKVFVLWIIAFAICLLSAKRGTIITLTLEMMLFYWWQLKDSRHKGIFLIGIVVVLAVASDYLYQYYLNDPYFHARVEATLQGKTSGRDILITKILSSFNDLGLIRMIVGCGFASTVTAAGNYAHNDWVEMLYDFGLIGIFVYAVFYISIILTIRKSKREIRQILALLLIAFLLPSFFSMVFFSESTSIGLFFLGCALAMNDKNKIKRRTRYSTFSKKSDESIGLLQY